MDSAFICEYCNKGFLTKGNLNRHINKSNRCINERNSINIKCESPLCKFSSNSHILISQHQYHCEQYIKFKEDQVTSQKSIIDSANEKILMLNDMLQKELSKTKTINNIKNISKNDNRQIQSNRLTIDVRNNIFGKILNPAGELFEKITEHLENNMTIDHIIDLKKFHLLIVDMITSDNYYACLDQIGCNFVNKEADGMIKTDVYAQNLLEFISEPVKLVAKDIASKEIKKLSQEAANADDEKIEENKRKKINLIKSQFGLLQNIKDDSKGLRKLLAQKTFYPRSKIQELIHEDKSTMEIKLIESSQNEALHIIPLSEMICEEIVTSIYANNSEEEIQEIYSNIGEFMSFIIHKFLICEQTLIYKYDRDDNQFFYYENTKDTYEKQTEKYCNSIHKYFYEKTKQLIDMNLSITFSETVLAMINDIEMFSEHMKKYLTRYQEILK